MIMKLRHPTLSLIHCRQCVNARKNGTSSKHLLKLNERGMFKDIFPSRDPFVHNILAKPQHIYCGYDPTADSLHIGNLLTVVALLHCQRAGHTPICLVGGATALVGDPSGKRKERDVLQRSEVQKNVSAIKQQLESIFHNHEKYMWKQERPLPKPVILNNMDWYEDLSMVDFLCTVGRHFRVTTMMSRESVKRRIESEAGISFTEFSYQTLQAYDFLQLHRTFGCLFQIGGNDQMGNMMSGYELVRRVVGKTVYGLTVPLVTSISGDKLGKTSGNAVWLDPKKNSPFALYQYLLGLNDFDACEMLKLFTFVDENVLTRAITKHMDDPSSRRAHRMLAEHVVLLVHGRDGLTSAQKSTAALFESSVESLAEMSKQELLEALPGSTIRQLNLECGMSVGELALKANCFKNPETADRLIKAGALHINHTKQESPDMPLLEDQHILPNGISLLRVGKRHWYIIDWLR